MKRAVSENYHIALMSYHKPAMTWLLKYLKDHKVKKIAYIMNAAKRNIEENPNFIYNDREKLIEAGFRVDIINLDHEKKLETHFLSYECIYVRGGNTFDLLDSIRRSGFDLLLPKMLDQGKMYVGSSAGSIILSPEIEIAENDFMSDENIVGLVDKSGLNIVDFAVFPHWADRFESDLNSLVNKLNIKYPIKKLKDNQVILIKSGKSKIIEV